MGAFVDLEPNTNAHFNLEKKDQDWDLVTMVVIEMMVNSPPNKSIMQQRFTYL